MNEIKVSIIVAIYKSEPFLRKCINSLIEQTYPNLEILLIDDGSPDNSGLICDEFKKKDKRIKVIHKQNGGACEARNYGLMAATGEYIVIVDGDDWLEKDYIEYLLNIIMKTGAQMALSDKIFTTRDRVQVQTDKMEIWMPEDAVCKIIYPYMEIGPWNKMYSRKLLLDNNITFSVPWSGEGLYFAVMAAQFANKVGVGHRKIYNYRLNNTNSGLTNYNVQMGINALYNINNIREHLCIDSRKVHNAVKWHIWKNYQFLLFLIIVTHNEEKYAREYKECLINIRTMLPQVIIKSDLPIKSKLGMLYVGLFPKKEVRRVIKVREKNLKKDKMD